MNPYENCTPASPHWLRRQRRREYGWPPRHNAVLVWCAPPWLGAERNYGCDARASEASLGAMSQECGGAKMLSASTKQ
jgi:hypothetical protein